VGTTDIETGQSVYFSKEEMDDGFTPVRASCSLPLIANIVKYKGHLLFDGGCSEPIPIKRSINDGNKKNIIVLTQDASYREKSGHGLSYLMLCIKYRRYPNLIRLMKNHSKIYNSEANLCTELEKEGKAIVIRPSVPVELRRYNDTEMLFKIYRMGMDDCREKLLQIEQFTA
jgi:predicted patatin/cPLA2 family phospholipase